LCYTASVYLGHQHISSLGSAFPGHDTSVFCLREELRRKVIEMYWVAVGPGHVILHHGSVDVAQSHYSISITVGTGSS